jgi:hypothetical protein
MQSTRKTELIRPILSCKWPSEFLPQDLVKLTHGLIGRPTAYELGRQIGSKRGKGIVIQKADFFSWLLGEGNIYVQAMKRGTERGEAAGSSRRSYISGG